MVAVDAIVARGAVVTRIRHACIRACRIVMTRLRHTTSTKRTIIAVYGVITRATVCVARIRRAFIDIFLAIATGKTRRTRARITINQILTRGTVKTAIRITVVDIGSAMRTRKARCARTCVAVVVVETRGVVCARTRFALVNISLTVATREAGRTATVETAAVGMAKTSGIVSAQTCRHAFVDGRATAVGASEARRTDT